MPPLEDSLSVQSRRGRIGPFLRPGDVASLDGRKHPFQAHPSQTLLLASPSQEPSFPSDHAVAAFAIAIAALAVFSPGPNRRSPVVAAPSRLTDPLVAPVGKRSTPRKGCARSTRTGAVFRLSGGGGIRTLERPVTSNGFRDSYEIGNCRDFCGWCASVCASPPTTLHPSLTTESDLVKPAVAKPPGIGTVEARTGVVVMREAQRGPGSSHVRCRSGRGVLERR